MHLHFAHTRQPAGHRGLLLLVVLFMFFMVILFLCAPASVGNIPPDGLGLILRAETDGLRIIAVACESPAEKAGLLPGDLLTQAGDIALSTADGLKSAVKDAEKHGIITLTYERNLAFLSTCIDLSGH